MKRYDYIMFDWDGTLAKMLDIWQQSLQSALQSKGYSLADHEIGADYAAFGKRFENHGIDNLVAILEEASEMAEARRQNVDLYPGASKVLMSLKNNNKKLALVTTSTHSQIDPLLNAHSMLDLFDVVVCADDVEAIKPNPEPLLKAIKLLAANPTTALMVGDSDNDLKAASAAGIDSVLFYPDSHSNFHDIEYLKTLEPTYIISQLEDLLLT